MRHGPIVGVISLLIAASLAVPSVAAENKKTKRQAAAPATPVAPAPEAQAAPERPSLLSEFRFGFSAQDPWGPEKSGAVSGELLFAKPFTPADLFTSYFIPRPHVGASGNFGGQTSFAYAGLTWSIDVTERVFLEGAFSGAIQNNPNDPFEGRLDKVASGCSPLFREAGAVGVKLSKNWSLMALVEHMPNGGCGDGRSLTNFGARFGYSF